MALIPWLAGTFGTRAMRRTVLATVMVATLLGATLLVVSQRDTPWSPGAVEPLRSTDQVDSDGDGLADALENILGSDPQNASTLAGVPDGWLYSWYGPEVDWNRPEMLDVQVMQPPAGSLPRALEEHPPPAPTLKDLFEHEAAWRGDRGSVWWASGPTLDPREWDNNHDGIADIWMLQFGLDPLSADPAAPAPGDDGMTLRQKYDAGLDPTTDDTDGDGLRDQEELAGRAAFNEHRVDFRPTDPLRFSTLDDHIADGYLIFYGLDPHAAETPSSMPAGDGVSVLEAFTASKAHCRASTDMCDWRRQLEEGETVDPTRWDTLGDGVPDAWSLRDPHGVLHPLLDASETIIDSTADWDAAPWAEGSADLEGLVVDAANPAPPTYELTALDAYRFLRPVTWDEATDGPWWGGLPTRIEPRDGALPPAVAMRGWNIVVDVGLGRNATQPAAPDELRTVHVQADPRSTDTDGDGILDIHEYYGILPDGTRVGRTNPSDPDTDGDGLGDLDERRWATDPLRRDTSGSFLTDGEEEAYWSGREAAAFDLLLEDPDEAHEAMTWLLPAHELEDGVRLGAIHITALAPNGDLDGDGVPNILDRDSDGDGLPDGVERDPNRFYEVPSKYFRPSTDPARPDTDGDSLPDWWEIAWSRDNEYACDGECELPDLKAGGQFRDGWPLDPTKPLSLPAARASTDFDVDLSQDVLILGPDIGFGNGLAYQYGLDPYADDTNRDGLSDMFSIHWGSNAIPAWAETLLRETPDLGWARDDAALLNSRMQDRGLQVDLLVIDPTDASHEARVTADADLLAIMPIDGGARQKGTWLLAHDASCGDHPLLRLADAPPSRREADYEPEGAGDSKVPDRNDLEIPANVDACWIWDTYPLGDDAERHTNPWRHDSDDDGLPDAWEAAYDQSGAGLVGQAIIPGALAGNAPGATEGSCRDTNLHTGLTTSKQGADRFCITYLEAYRLGIDPNSRDSDGGGLPDWQEIGLGLNPLDRRDDAGEEDWDADGILNMHEDELGTNRLHPDTDRDGLLDGDLEGLAGPGARPFLKSGQGEGNLCLPAPGSAAFDETVPNMEERPATPRHPIAGSLTYAEIHAWYVELGLLHALNSSRCSGVQGETVLFKREGIRDPENGVVLPQGTPTSSLLWDSSGDGVPDGWKVYWRDATSHGPSRTALRPDIDSASCKEPTFCRDPDGDLVNIPDEYAWTRPSDWLEARDGPWWGGLDPTRRDTDGDDAWFEFVAAQDRREPAADQDQDNDGIPDTHDPYPGMDTENTGIVRWSETIGGYVTDFDALWPALDSRVLSYRADSDNDRIPDLLDRVRVAIAVETAPANVRKDGSPFIIEGTVTLNEPLLDDPDYDAASSSDPAAGDGAAVGGLTVKAILRHGPSGQEALVGAGFTEPDGTFTIEGSIASAIPTPPLHETMLQASVGGSIVQAGKQQVLRSDAPLLPPGEVELRIDVEANDAGIQPLVFSDGASTYDAAVGSKQAPFAWLPTDENRQGSNKFPSEAIALDASGEEPDTMIQSARHTAEAVFPASSVSIKVELMAPTEIILEPLTPVLAGEPLHIAGRLQDRTANPLPDQEIELSFTATPGRTAPALRHATTREDGSFEVNLTGVETQDLKAGPLTVTARADQLAGAYLTAPQSVESATTIRQATAWDEPYLVDGQPSTNNGTAIMHAIEDPLTIRAGLRDHLGQYVPDRDVTIHLIGLDGSAVIDPQPASTNETGWLDHAIEEMPPDMVAQNLELRVVQDPATALDESLWLSANVQPRFSVEIPHLAGDMVAMGEDALVTGTLRRTDGTPVASEDAVFIADSSAGDVIVFNGTDASGQFQFTFSSAEPTETSWQVRSLPTAFFAGSPPATAATIHYAETRIELDSVEGLRGQTVPVTGRLVREDGRPLAATEVELRWADGNESAATTDSTGNFSALLPARDASGLYDVQASFPGSGPLRPSDATTQARILVLTRLAIEARDIVVPDDPLEVKVRLVDDRQERLAARQVHIEFMTARGHAQAVDKVTNADGAFIVTSDDVEVDFAGPWTVNATYSGDTFETPATNITTMVARHLVEIQIQHPRTQLRPGAFVQYEGTLNTTAFLTEGLALKASVDGKKVGEARSAANGTWSLAFRVPALAAGNHTLTIGGPGTDFLEIQERSVPVVFVSGVRAEIEETVHEDGARDVRIEATLTSGAPAARVVFTLVRTDPNGTVIGVHEVTTDEQGAAVLRLDAKARGNLTVAGILNPSLDLEDFRTSMIVPPSPDTAPSPWWITAAVAAFVVAGALAATYAVWRHRHRRDLGQVFDDAHRILLDPSASPHEVIQAVYQNLLTVLRRSCGLDFDEHATARDIEREAVEAFRLPTKSMQTLTGLFELAIYSRRPLGPEARQDALRSFQALAAALSPTQRNATDRASTPTRRHAA